MKWLLSALLVLSLLGCSARYQVQSVGGTGAVHLDRARAVYIAVPRDGAYGGSVYSGSGQVVAQAVAAAFSEHVSSVRIADAPLDTSESLAVARSLGAGYLIVPVISQWEQRATEWSGRPSRMAIRLTLIDVATGAQLGSSALEGRSRILSLTSTNPESLLRDPLAQYVRGLY